MIEYIKDYARLVIRKPQPTNPAPARAVPELRPVSSFLEAVRQIAKELDRLDPKDFEPAAQSEFLRIRGNIAVVAKMDHATIVPVETALTPLIEILDSYRGPGSGGVTRQFGYLSDPELRAIVERDYAELVVKLYPAGTWKSCVILAGSVLEAILFDRLADAVWYPQAIASPKAHRMNGTAIPMADWKLNHLIDIAVDIRLLPADPANTIHQVLRDYRNFVHPKKEIRAAHACTEAEAMLSIGALDSVCNYLEAHP